MSLKLHHEGEKGTAICESCSNVVTTTFQYRTVPLSDQSGVVPDVLVAVCDRCDAVVGIPPQATPAIKAAMSPRLESIELKLSVPYFEILDLATYRIDPELPTTFRKTLLSFYLRKMTETDQGFDQFKDWISLADTKWDHRKGPTKRLSLRVRPQTRSRLETLVEHSGLTRTHVVRGIIEGIDQDIVQPDSPQRLKELESLATACMA